MDHSEKIREDFRKVALSIQRSVNAEQLWRTLGDPDNHEDYRKQFNTYIPFFESVRDLAICQVITNLARANDHASGALGIESLIDRLAKADYDDNQVKLIRQKYKSNEEQWGKIKKLRDKSIVHSAAEHSEIEIFESVDITADEISDSTALAREIMLNIGKLIDAPHTQLDHGNRKVRDDCNKLLRHLKSGRSAILREL